MKRQLHIGVLALAVLSLTSCEDEVFDDQSAQQILEASKIQLSGEQVLLSPDQVLCGEKKGLWVISQLESGGAIGRLTVLAKNLDFGDDVRMGDRKFSNPYTQLHGSFNVKVEQIVKMTDENPKIKVVEAKLGVIVEHECFEKPLTLLGIERGDFSEDAPPRIRLRQRNGWTTDQILH